MSDLFDEAAFMARRDSLGRDRQPERVVTVAKAREIARQMADHEAAFARAEPPPNPPEFHILQTGREWWRAYPCSAEELAELLRVALLYVEDPGKPWPVEAWAQRTRDVLSRYVTRRGDVAPSGVGGTDA